MAGVTGSGRSVAAPPRAPCRRANDWAVGLSVALDPWRPPRTSAAGSVPLVPGPAVDILVVVGADPPPRQLEARAGWVFRLAAAAELTPLIAELRGHIPRLVGI